MRLKPIAPEEVLELLFNGETVYRANIDDMVLCNLVHKSIKVIKRDLEKEDTYLYFSIVGGEVNNE